ncbi:hypothetical protein [Hydrogenophaga sp.]|uniref:hypothetical protein n=1 Tax=Hydrogenophaga sp. TaxID=1904254 RepID=UPI00286DB020|nr:hypothetical protein [Hydrogenophaga sp.]
MNAQQFVSHWLELKAELLEAFLGKQSKSEVAIQIQRLELEPQQSELLRAAVDGMLRDTMYTLLLGLDGAASIGRDQRPYTITDEDGNVISKCGELEAEAWRQLHGGSQ